MNTYIANKKKLYENQNKEWIELKKYSLKYNGGQNVIFTTKKKFVIFENLL